MSDLTAVIEAIQTDPDVRHAALRGVLHHHALAVILKFEHLNVDEPEQTPSVDSRVSWLGSVPRVRLNLSDILSFKGRQVRPELSDKRVRFSPS